jgi:hypothetical protein
MSLLLLFGGGGGAPATIEPAAYEAPETHRRRGWRVRRALPDAPVYPNAHQASGQSPDKPFVTRTVRSRRLQTAEMPPVYPAPAAPPADLGWLPRAAQQKRVKPLRRPYEAFEVTDLILANPAQPISATAIERAHRRTGWRKHQQLPLLLVHPETPVSVSSDRALDVPFVTRAVRSRRHVQAPPLAEFAQAEPVAEEPPRVGGGFAFNERDFAREYEAATRLRRIKRDDDEVVAIMTALLDAPL